METIIDMLHSRAMPIAVVLFTLTIISLASIFLFMVKGKVKYKINLTIQIVAIFIFMAISTDAYQSLDTIQGFAYSTLPFIPLSYFLLIVSVGMNCMVMLDDKKFVEKVRK